MGSLTSEYMFSKCRCCKEETTWGLQGAAVTVGPWCALGRAASTLYGSSLGQGLDSTRPLCPRTPGLRLSTGRQAGPSPWHEYVNGCGWDVLPSLSSDPSPHAR